jgi:hypothetical protein
VHGISIVNPKATSSGFKKTFCGISGCKIARPLDLCTSQASDESILASHPYDGLQQRVGQSSFVTRTRPLAHLFQHQIDHRGQVHAMLAGTHIQPPQLDEFLCEVEAELRAVEFAELGFSAANIWR